MRQPAEVKVSDGHNGERTLSLDSDGMYVDSTGQKRRFYNQDELKQIFEKNQTHSPEGYGAFADSDHPGLMAGHKSDYQVSLEQVQAQDHPQGLELSTKENRLVTKDKIVVQTDQGPVQLPKGYKLPIGTQIDKASGAIVTPADGVRLESGRIVKSQPVDLARVEGGQHLNAGVDGKPGDWIVNRKAQDRYGNDIWDSYTQIDSVKNKKWTHSDSDAADVFRAKTDQNKEFVLMPDGDYTIVPSYGGVASNDGPSVLVKDGDQGYYYIGIDELKQTHVGDAKSQEIIDRVSAKWNAEQTGGHWDASHPSEYAVKQTDGNWRIIQADGKVITAQNADKDYLARLETLSKDPALNSDATAGVPHGVPDRIDVEPSEAFTKSATVKAVQVTEETKWTNPDAAPGERDQIAQKGDWWIYPPDGGAPYVAPKDFFQANYNPMPGFPGQYAKVAVADASVLDRAAAVRHPQQGITKGGPGDYVVNDAQGQYIVSRAKFEGQYTPVNADLATEPMSLPKPTGEALDLGAGVTSTPWEHGDILRNSTSGQVTVSDSRNGSWKMYENGKLTAERQVVDGACRPQSNGYDLSLRRCRESK